MNGICSAVLTAVIGCMVFSCSDAVHGITSSEPTPFDNTSFTGMYKLDSWNTQSPLKGAIGASGEIIELIVDGNDTLVCSGRVNVKGDFDVRGEVSNDSRSLKVHFKGTLNLQEKGYTGEGTWQGTDKTPSGTVDIAGTWILKYQ